MTTNAWRLLEALPGVSALPAVWERHLGEEFPAFNGLCLEASARVAKSMPCARECGCFHSVIVRHDRAGAIGVCRCSPPKCPDVEMTIREATPLVVDSGRLCRALGRALGLSSRFARLSPAGTHQFGCWSTDAVPAILTVQPSRQEFRSAVAEVAASLHRPFILFGPTNQFIDAACQAMLEASGAAFFPIDGTVVLTSAGSLRSLRPPEELFRRFTAQTEEPVAEETARQLFALARTLDGETGLRKAPLSTVLRLFCIEDLEPKQIARRLGCSKSLVYSRLGLLSRKLGREPAELRQFSTHLQGIEESLSDSRAARIYRAGEAEL